MMRVTGNNGLFTRILGLLELVDRLPDNLSDEETAGLLKLLPPESQANMRSVFAPHVREAGIAFLKTMSLWMRRARQARAMGRKVILVPFNFPPDLVNCFANAVPLTSEVLSSMAAMALEGGGERYWDVCMSLGLPDHICSSNSIEIGAILGGDFAPDAIISAAPGGCDANAKVHEFAAEYLGIPQFILEKPVDDSPAGHRLYRTYFRKLISQLEDFTGETLSEERMRRVLTGANRCTELYWELWETNKARPAPAPNMFSVFLAPLRFCMWGDPEAIRALEIMVRIAKQRLAAGATAGSREIARVLWAYTSYYFDVTNLHHWMELQGYTHLADVLDLYNPQPVDTTSKESMIEAMIAAAWDYPMNRQMAAPSMSEAWIQDMVHVARELGADCLIHCGHDACKQSWSVVSILREEMMKRAGLPVLVLHGDSWRKTTTPITVIQREIDEFIRQVVAKKRVGQKRIRRRNIVRHGSLTE